MLFSSFSSMTPVPHALGRLQPGVLRLVYPTKTEYSTTPSDINVVVVPELGSAGGNSLDSTPWSWLSEVESRSAIRPLVLIFDYKVNRDGVPIWQAVSEQGVILLHELIVKKEEIGLFNLPLVFIAHGMGGTVVKKALNFLHEDQYDLNLRQILEVHSGSIFLGTPHPTNSRPVSWQFLQYILRSTAKFSKRSLLQAEQEAAIISNISHKFESTTDSKLPVLSVYEDKGTRIQGSLFGSRHILVDVRSAETLAGSETLIGVQKDHLDICEVEVPSELFDNIVDLFQKAVQSSSIPQINFDSLVLDESAWASTVGDADELRVMLAQSKITKGNTRSRLLGTTEASSEVIPTLNDFLQDRPAPKLPCHLLGPEEPIQEFVGRAEIMTEILSVLEEPTISLSPGNTELAAPRSFALCGTPGMGKSRLATEYMHKHKDKYDAVFWINADDENSLAEDFLSIAKELGLLNSSEMKDGVIARNVVIEWLANPLKQALIEDSEDSMAPAPHAEWLLIFDNADDLSALDDYWPETGPGAILMTSRDPAAKQYKTNRRGCNLQPLLEGQSAELLRKLTDSEDTNVNIHEAALLADRLGNLPLALFQVAAVIKRKDMKFSEFLQIFKEEESRNELLLDEASYSHTLSTIWRIDEQPPAAKSLLHVLCLLDRSEIRDSLFEAHLPSDPPDAFPTSRLKYYDARDHLAQTSLIRKTGKSGRITIHPLLQLITRARMLPQELENAFSTAVKILISNWPKSSYLFSHEMVMLEGSKDLVPHAKRMADEYDKNPGWNIPLTAQRDLAELLQKGGWHVAEKGNFATAQRMYKISLKICERNAEKIPHEYADALFVTASHMSNTNQFESHKEMALKHFDQRMKTQDRNQPQGLAAGLAYSELAQAYLLNEEYDETIANAKKARAIYERSQEFLQNDFFPFFPIMHHALALFAMKRYEEAAALIDEIIKWREATFGVDDIKSYKLGFALQILGQIKLSQGQNKESATLYRRALNNYTKTIGSTHHRTGHVLVKMADHEARIKHVELAETLYDKAISIFKSHSCYDPELARTKFRRAELHKSEGDLETAAQLLREAQLLYQKIVGIRISFDRKLDLEDFDRIVAIWAR